jgi:hypothetical protein
VFVGHAVTGTTEAAAVVEVVSGLRHELTDWGWQVRPDIVVDTAVADQVRAGEGRRLVQRNVDHIATSALLVLLADHAADTSSLWIEAGVAIASCVPVAVVADAHTTLPFLLASAFGDDPGPLPACRRLTANLFTGPAEHRRIAAKQVAHDLTVWAQVSRVS